MFETICETDGCPNKGIVLTWPEIGNQVFCGPCGNEIINIVEVK